MAPLLDLSFDGVHRIVVEQCLLDSLEGVEALGLSSGGGVSDAFVPFQDGAGGGGGGFACGLELVSAVGELGDARGYRGSAFAYGVELGGEVLQPCSGVVVVSVAR